MSKYPNLVIMQEQLIENEARSCSMEKLWFLDQQSETCGSRLASDHSTSRRVALVLKTLRK